MYLSHLKYSNNYVKFISELLIYIFILITLFIVLLSNHSYAQNRASQDIKVDDIIIEGNERIENSTIISYLNLKENSVIDQYEINSSLKNLYATGWFSDIKILRKGDDLIVKVAENPIVNIVAFEGNERVEDDELSSEISLKSRSVYNKASVANDVKRIQQIYRRSGRFAVKVVPKAIQREQNRVDVVFEIDEGVITRVQRIQFIGNKNFSDEALEGIIATKEERWYRFFSSDDTYDPDKMKYDQELLRRFYFDNGYADFNIESAVAEITPEKDGFYITYTVSEGQKYKFGNIELSSELEDRTGEELKQMLDTVEGEQYSASLVESSVDKLIEELGSLGYAFVDVQPIRSVNRDELAMNVKYFIKQGPRVYVERINIFGNVRTLDNVIRRELRLVEGDPYSTTKLKRSEQRIRNLGFFEKVEVSNIPGSTPDKTVINIEVSEKSTGELTFGVGYSTLDGALADVSIRERNLLGKGQNLRLRLSAAQERQQIDLGFTEPYFLDRDLRAGFDLFSVRQDNSDISSYDRESTGGKLRFGYSLTEHLYHNVYYSLRNDNITNVDSDASRYIQEQEGENLTSAVGHSFNYDKRDNRFDPRSGYLLSFSQEVAGLAGDAEYLRNEVNASYYIPIYEDWVMLFAGSGGYVFGFGDDEDDLSINHRFFIGSEKIRGFDRAGIGPRDKETGDALGGNMYYAGTAELMFPIGLPNEWGFRGALFADAGSLWEVDEDICSDGTVNIDECIEDDDMARVSVGAGVTWRSPFGPLRIDYAYPIEKNRFDDEQRFKFSFGTRF